MSEIILSDASKVTRGNLVATSMRTVIVASHFNNFFVEKLVEGAIDALVQHGASRSQQTIIWVPGAFEIPLTAQKAAQLGKFDAVICLGAVIRGETDHYEHVSGAAVNGIAQLSLKTGVPATLGLLTVDTIEQAIARSGSKMGNQGWSAAVAAIEWVNVLKSIEQLV